MKGDDLILIGVIALFFVSPWAGIALIVIGFMAKD